MESYKQQPPNWRIVLKISYFAPKHRHNVLKIKEESPLDWLLDIWGQKQKKLEYEHKQIHN